jgi:uncharacterized protein YbjT (DUF2867 family)
MKIVVIGGTGLLGSRLVEKARASGHEVLAASRSSGVDAYTGIGLERELVGATVVVDVSNAISRDDAAVTDFFRTTSRALLAAEATAGVGHHVVLSVVGVERLHESGYFGAKLAQENVVRGGTVPYTILRATQFFEFIARIADASTNGDTVRLPPVLVQPVAADDVAAALVEAAVSAPANGVVELAGPERFRLDVLAERVLGASDDPRRVRADRRARYFGAEVDERSLLPGADARIGPTRLGEWLGSRRRDDGRSRAAEPRRGRRRRFHGSVRPS